MLDLCWSYFGIMLVLLCSYAGVILGLCWGHFAVMLELFLSYVRVMLDISCSCV